MTVNVHELLDVLAWGDRLDCDVFVNTVTNPPRFSLHHLSDADLSEVASMLEAADADAHRVLRRNLAVWDRSVDYVRSLASRQAISAVDATDPIDLARAWSEEWAAGTPLVTIEADDSLLIRKIGPDPTDVFGLDLRHIIDSPSISFIRALGPHLGDLVESTMHVRGQGIEQRVFRFANESGGAELTAMMAPTGSGETWFVALHHLEAVPVGVPRRRSR
jgi:hypothetical protein